MNKDFSKTRNHHLKSLWTIYLQWKDKAIKKNNEGVQHLQKESERIHLEKLKIKLAKRLSNKFVIIIKKSKSHKTKTKF